MTKHDWELVWTVGFICLSFGYALGIMTGTHITSKNMEDYATAHSNAKYYLKDGHMNKLHIYDWLDEEKTDLAELKVQEFLDFRTRDAVYQMENRDKINGLTVFCEYKGTKYKITGASRLGDIWLDKNFKRESGYDLRVMIEDCSEFSFEDLRKEN